jgi:murein DD-endopeptidase MepM/ murein hydrolase activator NlpD
MTRRTRSGLVTLGLVMLLSGAVGRAEAQTQLQPASCDQPVRSVRWDVLVTLGFENQTAQTVDMAWIDYGGVDRPWFTIPPGGRVSQQAYNTHPWRASAVGACIAVFVAGTENATAIIGSRASVVTHQPHGILLSAGTSLIYPVFDSNGWSQTFGSPYHTDKDAFAQDWARSCGATAGRKVYAGISGKVVYAGWRTGYGNSVDIWDERSGFLLRFGHFRSLDVQQDDWALAGITEIGRVGNSGAAISTGCTTDPGAHLHVSLYKDVTSWPMTLGSANAARFGYVAPVRLIKSSTSPAVYVHDGSLKRPVTAFAYETNGWGFSSAVNFVTTADNLVQSLPLGSNWPPRNNVRFSSASDQTVYFIEDNARRGVPGWVFSCRGWSFDESETRTVPANQPYDFVPRTDVPALNSCFNETQQAIDDMVMRAASDPRGRFDTRPFLHQYSAPNMLNDPNWEWRQMLFRLHDGREVWMAHITYRYNAAERYTEFWDPDTRQNTGWIRAQ